MELKDEKIIEAPRDRVYAALNDPDVLRQCIPGCKSLEKVDDTHFDAVASLKVGPVKATFNGHVELQDLDPPKGYTIVGEGKGGVAGFAKGSARVDLVEEGPETTRLCYDAKAEVGGKLAQLGSRLIDSTAKKLAGEFFAKFKEVVEGPAPAEAPATPAETPVSPAATAALESEPVGAGGPAAPEPTRDPAAATVSMPAGGAMQSADRRPDETPPREAPAGADQAAADAFRQDVAEKQREEAGSAEAGGGGLPWRWVAAAVAALVILAILAF